MDSQKTSAKSVVRRTKRMANQIYSAYLPPYLKRHWTGGRGKWYEEWLKEQLQMLVVDEVFDDQCRLEELEGLQDRVAVVFALFATSFRILDHIGMHLRAQTWGQYELWPEDDKLLASLCRKFLKSNRVLKRGGPEGQSPFGGGLGVSPRCNFHPLPGQEGG